jgi:hypothetical protein
MAWGDKKAQQRRDAVENGGTLKGRQAKKATRTGGLGDDGKVRDTKGRVTGDFSGRQRRQGNEHGV